MVTFKKYLLLKEDNLPPVDSIFRPEAFQGIEAFMSRSKIIRMDIDQFLDLAKPLNLEISKRAEKSFKEKIKWNQLPFLYIDTDKNGIAQVNGHEGRHRAKVLKRAGYKEMPVEIKDRGDLRWDQQDNPKNHSYFEKFPEIIVSEDKLKRYPFPFTREEGLVKYVPDFGQEEENEEDVMGMNVQSKKQDFADQIINGEKTIETRNTNSLKSKIGKRVGVIKTGRGTATLLGYVTLGEPKIYKNKEEFDKDYDKHLVSPDDKKFYIKNGGIKYGYPLTNVVRLKRPKEILSHGIVFRRI